MNTGELALIVYLENELVTQWVMTHYRTIGNQIIHDFWDALWFRLCPETLSLSNSEEHHSMYKLSSCWGGKLSISQGTEVPDCIQGVNKSLPHFITCISWLIWEIHISIWSMSHILSSPFIFFTVWTNKLYVYVKTRVSHLTMGTETQYMQ